jgi:hypothetical protein
MNKHFIRAWKEFDVDDIKSHLLVFGLKSGICENCNNIINDITTKACPVCANEFRYIAFRPEVTQDSSFYAKLKDKFSAFIAIEYNDYKKLVAKSKAFDIFKKEK